jgi:prevent-host-death family protein
MKIASVADVKARFSAYVQASAQGPVVVTRNGKPVAALIAVEDEDELERLVLAYSPKFREMARSARRRLDEGKAIPHDDFWHEVEEENRERAKTKGGNRKGRAPTRRPRQPR